MHCNVIISHTSNSLIVRARDVVVLLSVHVVKIIRRIDKRKKKKEDRCQIALFFGIVPGTDFREPISEFSGKQLL